MVGRNAGGHQKHFFFKSKITAHPLNLNVTYIHLDEFDCGTLRLHNQIAILGPTTKLSNVNLVQVWVAVAIIRNYSLVP